MSYEVRGSPRQPVFASCSRTEQRKNCRKNHPKRKITLICLIKVMMMSFALKKRKIQYKKLVLEHSSLSTDADLSDHRFCNVRGPILLKGSEPQEYHSFNCLVMHRHSKKSNYLALCMALTTTHSLEGHTRNCFAQLET